MKHAKDRVIALDYFRGICMLAVIMNHSWMFSMPYAYLAGAGNLWTSAAEMFFIISGITLWIVRGPKILENFPETAKKIWRRALNIYVINIVVVFLSLAISPLLISKNLVDIVLGPSPSNSGIKLISDILTFHYAIGLGAFLMFYSIYMLFAPFALYAMRKKYWMAVPIASIGLYALAAVPGAAPPFVEEFLLWQVYFFLGITIGKFRVPIIGWFYSLPKTIASGVETFIIGLAGLALTISVLLDFNIFPTINRLTADGWLPVKLRSAYIHLLNLRPETFALFQNHRTGYLRPLAAILFLAAAYLIYQRYKNPILLRTGRIVNTFGSDTLWIFVAQAIAIPLLSALSLPRNLLINTALTGLLFWSMWCVTQRRAIRFRALSYISSLKLSYSQAKYNYLAQYEENE